MKNYQKRSKRNDTLRLKNWVYIDTYHGIKVAHQISEQVLEVGLGELDSHTEKAKLIFSLYYTAE